MTPPPEEDLEWAIVYALRHKSATLRAVKPRLEDLQLRAIARSIIEYLRLSNWKIERGPPAQTHSRTVEYLPHNKAK
jgi:hypothetical protein